MASAEFNGSRSVSLNDLIALNDEIAALVRAGVPLEQGLLEIGQEISGGLGNLATNLGKRLRDGESLERILADDHLPFPPVWRAVVEAGLRSGRLAAALEGVSMTGRRVNELRRAVMLAMIYPLVILTLAYLLFIFLVTHLVPITYGLYTDFALEPYAALTWLAAIGDHVLWWGITIPVFAAACLGYWVYRSRGSVLVSDSASARFFSRCWPTVGRSLQDGRMAAFAEILSLLIKHRVPLDEAIVLAAEASGDRALSGKAFTIADRLKNGQPLTPQDCRSLEFPSLLGWLLSTGNYQPRLDQTLASMADRYRQRAARGAEFATVFLPIVATAVIGGTVTLIHGLAVFVPITHLLYALGS